MSVLFVVFPEDTRNHQFLKGWRFEILEGHGCFLFVFLSFFFQVLAKLICYKGPSTVTAVTVMCCGDFNLLESKLLGRTYSCLQLTTGSLFLHVWARGNQIWGVNTGRCYYFAEVMCKNSWWIYTFICRDSATRLKHPVCRLALASFGIR